MFKSCETMASIQLLCLSNSILCYFFTTVKNDMKSHDSHLDHFFLKQAIRLEIKRKNCCGVPLHLQTIPVNIVSQKWGAIYRCQSQFRIGCTAQGSGDCCNKCNKFPHETHAELKSSEILFGHNLFHRCPLILKFCTEHDCDTVMLCTIFQNDWANAIHVREG